MDESVRQNILDKVKTMLESIVDNSAVALLNEVTVGKITPTTLETVPLPVAFVFPGPDQAAPAGATAIDFETWDWTVTIEVWAKDIDMETILKFIHRKMAKDTPEGLIGGLAIDVKRQSSSGTLVVSNDYSTSAMLIDFLVRFRHPWGAP